jgi:photosystem II stability/assembly factor-like uncharacterized protein
MKYIAILLTFACSLGLMTNGLCQSIDINHLKGIKTRSLGPAGMSGRVTSIDVDLSDPDIIYVGTASGGLWRSPNGGINWEPLFDDQPLQSIGAVAVSQKNPDIIWAGTGEGNPRNSHNSGEGIYKSIDGGETWTCMGLKETRTIHRIIIHPDNPDMVHVAALGSAWGNNPERGVFRTTDGGKTWEHILSINDSTGCADLVVDPTNPDKFIAAMWEFGRKPWTFNSGGEGSGLYVTYDGGDTWQERTSKDGLPEGHLGRMGLAFAPSRPNIVYALVEAKVNALYKSTDGGGNWSKVSDKNIGDRPFYYADIFVDPKNENRIYNLYSRVSRSEDGGKTFETILPYWGVHPDHHAFWVHPEDPDYLIEGNDGGLNISRDGGANWRFIDNLPLAQFYHISVSMDTPYLIGGGMQDNGSWVGPSEVWKRGGILNSDWQEIYFGDGFDVLFDPRDSRYAYAMSQGGNVSRIDRETGKNTFIKPTHPNPDTELRFHWNAAIAQDPFDGCGLYFGSQFVHKSTDCGQSWELISPDLTTNDSLKQLQHLSGGLTIDDTEAENHTTILAIAPSPADRQVIWVGTDDGNLQLTRDGGATWTNLGDRLPGARPNSWIPYIEVSADNPAEAFVIVNDYRRNDWRPMAYHTIDFGQTFTRIADETKVSGHALCIVQDPEVPSLLWLGTDHGLYLTIDGGANWTKWDHDFPGVSTRDLKIHPREHDLVIGTFGRAAWVIDDIRPIREIARTGGAVLDEPFKAFPAPDAWQAEYRSYDGIRFTADGEFIGENARGGATVTLWVGKPKKNVAENVIEDSQKSGKKKKKRAENADVPNTADSTKVADPAPPKDNKVSVMVMNSAGDTIRTFSSRLDTGMNRITWGMDRDGYRFPSRRAPREDADPPGGSSVLPGTYTMHFTYGDFRDSTTVSVHADPRLEVSMEALLQQQSAADSFGLMAEEAAEGFDRLREMTETIELVSKIMVKFPDSLQTSLRDSAKVISDTIAELEKQFMTPDGLKGIQRSSDNLNSDLYRASSYLRSSTGPPNQAARRMMEKAHSRWHKIKASIQHLEQTTWQSYKKALKIALIDIQLE